ncbi:MAG: ABC transporter permease subunit [Verrucomicrobiales bacterium]|nr:ABC transporter permease subunit [Verrucomicrobiales bacterium]
MSWLIRVGGVGIIVAVFGIFFFVLMEILPLFGTASVEADGERNSGWTGAGVLGVDEWAERPFFFDGRSMHFMDWASGKESTEAIALPEGAVVSCWSFEAGRQWITVGTADGRVGSVQVKYQPTFSGEKRTITSTVSVGEFTPMGLPGVKVEKVADGHAESAQLLAILQHDPAGKPHVFVRCIRVKRGLMGGGKPAVSGEFDLAQQVGGEVSHLLAGASADSLLVVKKDGSVDYFFFENGASMELRQTFQPFAGKADAMIASAGFVFGGGSVVVSSIDGEQQVWSLYNQTVEKQGKTFQQRLFGKTKDLPKMDEAGELFAASRRNKVVMAAAGDFVTLRHTTSESVRWQGHVPFDVANMVMDGKSEHLFFLDGQGGLHRYSYEDPHPEAGWKAFFGKIWYEGASEPSYTWQSTGGTDDFEPKLSLVPLIIGSLKGTLYALVFAVPIALLAAIYSANFLPGKIRNVVKPTMEIMASLPSVVLGFLAGLWLAPLIEQKVPSVLLAILVLPLGTLLLGWAYTKLPVTLRCRVPHGLEFLLLVVPLAILVSAAWAMGPVIESWFFVVKDPGTGKAIADFRMWWPEATGTPYDQRNSLVVGFMMGFAVIPIVFTITDDALSNVPPQLRAASLALGATRWQMVRTVVLPVASAGIFSALMIGFGRAVGETMIVVMATGNTPVMDWNIFSGMRTLSANIAVELPEAPVHSTHYRALFLGAMVLFALTFVLNTVAEILRFRLRERFKLV